MSNSYLFWLFHTACVCLKKKLRRIGAAIRGDEEAA